MARLNASKSTAIYGRQPSTATKTQPHSFHRTTISSPLKPKQAAKKSSGFAEFKIFEDDDEEPPADAATGDHFKEPSHTAKKRPMAPLKLTHTNSITSGLSNCVAHGRSASSSDRSRSESDLDDEESSDKENIFFDDEAEEVSEESGEEEREEEERQELASPSSYDLDGEIDPTGELNREEPDAEDRRPKFMQYRESKVGEQSDESQSESAFDSEDGYGSLDDFIVSDNEDLSYYESENGFDEDEEEIEPPTPPPTTRRRLFRGRKPQPSGINVQTKKLTVSADDSFPTSPETSMAQNLPKRQTPPRLNSSFTRLSPNKVYDEQLEVTKEKKAKRSPLRESINSVSSTSENTRKKQENKMHTPPRSPSKIEFPSPSKSTKRIPPSPHRQSSDAFWSQDVTNSWNDQWSPPKQKTKSRAVERLLVALGETPDEIDETISADRGSSTITKKTMAENPTKSPSKTAIKKAEVAKRKEAAVQKKAFDDRKADLAQSFLTALDEITSGGQVGQLAEGTGGVQVTWSKTLRSTAGRARWKKEKIKELGKEIRCLHHASIELAEHVIDDEERLLNTLAHEYCHLANYMISGITNQPHGASFKQWGRKCVSAIRNHPEYKNYCIEVTTKHSYEIDYKYVWICVDCGHKYGRHSKSIDPTKSRCSLCKGGLQQVKPKPRNASQKKKGALDNTENSSFLTSGSTLRESLDNMVESLEKANLD